MSTVREQSAAPETLTQKRDAFSSISMKWVVGYWYSFSMSDMPYSTLARNFTPSLWFLPERVVIWMTPLPAREPYSDEAAAPFTTSMFSMSCGLMSCRPPCDTTPSMMYSGS